MARVEVDYDEFLRDPPEGEDRWAAGTTIASQQAIGAAAFVLATLIFALRVFSRRRIAKVQLRADDCKSFSSGGSRLTTSSFETSERTETGRQYLVN